jgi:hypothetical protein
MTRPRSSASRRGTSARIRPVRFRRRWTDGTSIPVQAGSCAFRLRGLGGCGAARLSSPDRDPVDQERYGLEADQTHRPWLIRGSDLKSFLGHRQSKRRCRLGPATLYCLGCKCPQEPAGRMADYVQQTSPPPACSAPCARSCGALMNKSSSVRISMSFGRPWTSRFNRRPQD